MTPHFLKSLSLLTRFPCKKNRGWASFQIANGGKKAHFVRRSWRDRIHAARPGGAGYARQIFQHGKEEGWWGGRSALPVPEIGPFTAGDDPAFPSTECQSRSCEIRAAFCGRRWFSCYRSCPGAGGGRKKSAAPVE
jgi:hypothetical protein